MGRPLLPAALGVEKGFDPVRVLDEVLDVYGVFLPAVMIDDLVFQDGKQPCLFGGFPLIPVLCLDSRHKCILDEIFGSAAVLDPGLCEVKERIAVSVNPIVGI